MIVCVRESLIDTKYFTLDNKKAVHLPLVDECLANRSLCQQNADVDTKRCMQKVATICLVTFLRNVKIVGGIFGIFHLDSNLSLKIYQIITLFHAENKKKNLHLQSLTLDSNNVTLAMHKFQNTFYPEWL